MTKLIGEKCLLLSQSPLRETLRGVKSLLPDSIKRIIFYIEPALQLKTRRDEKE
jgi:hypothetical protein